MKGRRVCLVGWIAFLTLVLIALGSGLRSVWGHEHGGHAAPQRKTQTRDEHGTGTSQAHGMSEGWKFRLSEGGDPTKGRAVFVRLECYGCHEVKGEKFAAPDPGKVGPELLAMASAHPPEYFAEAIINPNAVIEKGRGYEAADGSSKMPSYNEDITVQELLDLVAYLTSLGQAGTPPRH